MPCLFVNEVWLVLWYFWHFHMCLQLIPLFAYGFASCCQGGWVVQPPLWFTISFHFCTHVCNVCWWFNLIVRVLQCDFCYSCIYVARIVLMIGVFCCAALFIWWSDFFSVIHGSFLPFFLPHHQSDLLLLNCLFSRSYSNQSCLEFSNACIVYFLADRHSINAALLTASGSMQRFWPIVSIQF